MTASYARHGWTATGNVTGDPRVPVTCPECLGARAILERMELGMLAYLPVVCGRCSGLGTIRIERRAVA